MMRLEKESVVAGTGLFLILVYLLWATGVLADPISGTLCRSSESVEEMITAYDNAFSYREGADFDVKTTFAEREEYNVSSRLIREGVCVYHSREQSIDLYVVYEGKRVGHKKILGLARTPHGSPTLWGMAWVLSLPVQAQPVGSI